MDNSIVFWVGFHLFVLGMVYLDLKVFHRNIKELTFRPIALCCLFWVGLALSFNVLIGSLFGLEKAMTFLTAYLLEASLSIDNLFLFLVVFSFCNIEEVYQHRVLCYGILGALVFRLLFILLGISLLHQFEWMYFVFGAFLCVSAVFFLRKEEESQDLNKMWLVRLCKRFFRLDEGFHQGRFFLCHKKKWYITTLFLALLIIEVSDIIFAVDSIPAVLAITSDLFIAYTSNVFAVLGLRSFYFLLSHTKQQFSHLKMAIAIILFFIGVKLIILPFFKIPSSVTLGFIALTLLTSILISLKLQKK